MKKLLALALVALMAGGALAQWEGDNMMGMFFSDAEFSDATTNIVTSPAPFNAYIVSLNPEMMSVSGYEVGISISDPTVFVLSATGENGWTNFGDNTNHLAGFGTPVPVVDGAVVLCTMNMLYTGSATVDIVFGAATPPSMPEHDGPVLADGANPDILVPCVYTSHADMAGKVATLNGEGVIAVENHSLSGVKALFN
jgi:hypothetical protein